jgi:hypothetical protein
MSILSLSAQRLSDDRVVLPAGPRFSVGKFIVGAVVILFGIGVGVVVATIIALVSGLISIGC